MIDWFYATHTLKNEAPDVFSEEFYQLIYIQTIWTF